MVKLNEKQSPIPALSDKWYASEDGLIWNFHIRNGIHWGDGKNFTAEDVAYTVDFLMRSSVDSVYSTLLTNVATYAAVDSSNFKLVLKKPDSLTAERMTFPIIPKHLTKSSDKNNSNKPVGTGPYLYNSYVKDKYIQLKKNDNWWYLEARSDKSSELLFIDTIYIKLYKNSTDDINAFQSGEIDSMSIGVNDLNKYEGRTDIYLKKYVSRNFEFLAFNLNNPIFGDISVRKAIAAAIERSKIIKEVYNDDAISGDLPVIPDSWMFENKPGEASTSLNPRDILLEGGWKEKTNGFRKNINGVSKKLEVELLVNENNSRRIAVAEKICIQLVNAGIPAKVIKLSWNDLFARIDKSQFDLVYTGCRTTQIPDISFLYSIPYITSYSPLQDNPGRNISGYNSTIVNSYIDMLYKVNDNEAKMDIYSNIKTQIASDIPYIGFCFLKEGMIYKKNIRGSLEPFTWNRYYNITEWYKPVTR